MSSDKPTAESVEENNPEALGHARDAAVAISKKDRELLASDFAKAKKKRLLSHLTKVHDVLKKIPQVSLRICPHFPMHPNLFWPLKFTLTPIPHNAPPAFLSSSLHFIFVFFVVHRRERNVCLVN